MEILPTPKLDPQSQPWGRRVTQKAEDTERGLASLTTQVDLSNKGLAAQLNRLQQQVGELAIAVNSTVIPQTAHSSVTSFALTTSLTELTRSTFTTPDGYSQALVMAVCSVSAYNNNVGVNGRILVSADINGSTISSSQSTVDQITYGGASSTYSRLLTGLSGGSQFYTRAMAGTVVVGFSANANNIANLATMVMFLR